MFSNFFPEIKICNTSCFSTATMIARTRLIVMLYMHCLSYANSYYSALLGQSFTSKYVLYYLI
jgi:hypothetical protein